MSPRGLMQGLPLDLRSLALMRILLGGALLAVLLPQAGNLAAFYSDRGVLPRSTVIGLGGWHDSLHLGSGGVWLAGLLFALQLAAALALVLGWRTRLAAVLSYGLLLSMQNRNPLVALPFDPLLIGLLLWCLLLPAGARASFDAALAADPPPPECRHRSWAAVGLLVYAIWIFGRLASAAPQTAAPLPAEPAPWLMVLAGLSAFLPTRLWDAAERRLPLGAGLRVHYDGDCTFCRQSCRLIRATMLLPHAHLAPAQDSPRADALMRAHDSWVVIDASGTAHLKWAAFTAMLRASLPFAWLSWLLRAPPLQAPGDRLYDLVARRRAGLARATAWMLQARPVRFLPGVGLRLLGLLTLLVLLAAILAAGRVLPPTAVPDAPTRLLGLRPELPARVPAGRDEAGWLLVIGRQVDGTEVDVLRPGKAPDYARPRAPVRRYASARWDAYYDRLWTGQHSELRADFARFLCGDWNTRVEGSARLQSLRLVRMLRTRGGAGVAAQEQQVLHRHDCLASAAASEGVDAY